LAGRKALLYLDGAENADDLSSILDVCGGCGVLITSRRRRDALSMRRDVRPLPLDDAVVLLRAWGGPYAADEEAARRLCQLVGGLPMAVRLAGRYLAEVDEDVNAYLAWLEETPLEALDLGKRRRASVPVLLERSLSQVDERARAALSVAGVLAPAPFGAGAVAAGLDAPERDVQHALAELVSYGLLVRTAGRYVASHALVHTYARERCAPAAAAVDRLAAYYAAWAWEQSALGAEGYCLLDQERVHVMQVLERCAERSRSKGALLGLAWAMRDYLSAQGYWTDLRKTMGYGQAAAHALGDREREAGCLASLGDAHWMLTEYEEARVHYVEAIGIPGELDSAEIDRARQRLADLDRPQP
jgi:hypothetical protein